MLLKLLNLNFDENKNANELSHGQKKKVLVNRNLYNTDKSIYVFDEYLSAIDEKTSMNIHNYVIKFLKKNKKIGIFISHDKNEYIYYDKIIKL